MPTQCQYVFVLEDKNISFSMNTDKIEHVSVTGDIFFTENF